MLRLSNMSCVGLLAVILAGHPPTVRAADSRGAVETILNETLPIGDLAGATARLTPLHPAGGVDAHAQFGLGLVAVLEAVEKLAHNLHRYGLRPTMQQFPVLRLPVPDNPEPEPMTYQDGRALVQQFIDDLAKAAAVLDKVADPDVKLKVNVGAIRLDLNADGICQDEETFWKVFTTVAWRAAKLGREEQEFPIGFDAADVHWLIGYTHLLRGMLEAWLSQDTEEFFTLLAPQFFGGAPRSDVVLGFGERRPFDMDSIADAIAAIHLMSFDLADGDRLRRCREHLLSMIGRSRKCWERILQETDNDREWIPNAKQTSLTPLTVTDREVAGWKQFLDEAEAVLNGEKLIPHWRIRGPKLGINLKRVFEEPRGFDLVLWAHGIAAVPYVEEGEVVSQQTANSLAAAFQGRFLAFAVWFQ